MLDGSISLRGVAVNNLKQVDLDLPRGKLIAFCGVSGSGKTSLALDTLYAEGQRRYIETFSAYTRQFLEQLEKPTAERIDGVPPAIAVARGAVSRSNRSTVGTSTEIADYLRLLFAKLATLSCPQCGKEIVADSPQSVAARLEHLPPATRLMIGFRRAISGDQWQATIAELREAGFVRMVLNETTIRLEDNSLADATNAVEPRFATVVVDRLSSDSDARRMRDSVETAFRYGEGAMEVLIESSADARETTLVDGNPYRRELFQREFICPTCDIRFSKPQPRLFSFNSPLGACPNCEGFGDVVDLDMSLIVPDESKSIAAGAIAPWTTPAYAHELEELLALADDYNLPTNIPFRELSNEHLRLIREGVPERDFGGMNGFFAWLEKRKYKMHIRVFLSRWRSYRPCPVCRGERLKPEALAWRIGGKSIAELSAQRVDRLNSFFDNLNLTDTQRQIGRTILEQIVARLSYLEQVGLGYLSLDRTLRTLSGGEAQRVTLSSALGSSLVNMLYVLDEPTVGLHPADVDRLTSSIRRLAERGNTVVAVEHEEAMLRQADHLIEVGPGAGERGGTITFQGTLPELLTTSDNLTAAFLTGQRGLTSADKRRPTNRGRVKLRGARGHNLKNLTVEFPLGVLCVVAGVSGSGKSTLVQDTLFGALSKRLNNNSVATLDYDDVVGDGQIEDCLLVDQSPVARSPRSNPVTYVKAFDEIRSVMAETLEARTRNFTARHFSFNVEGGRCPKCEGDGYLQVDMQFLADMFVVCDDCRGKRYRREVLDVRYRGRNIADILNMTVREAFSFFRGQTKVQAKLKPLVDVGLDYLPLGQGANTLSAGESQRLKLAAYMAGAKRNRTLFLLDEPTTGLHFADIVRLLDCFDALLSVGHSLIVVEHNLQLLKAADHIIELGPGAGEDGGAIVTQGTPEEVAASPHSPTGKYLAASLAAEPK